MNKEETKPKEVVVSPKGEHVDPTEPKEAPKEKPKEETERKPGMMLYPAKEIHDRLIRIERMLEWLIVQRVTDDQKLIKQPNIADIFKEIASKMEPIKTVDKMLDETSGKAFEKKTEGGG